MDDVARPLLAELIEIDTSPGAATFPEAANGLSRLLRAAHFRVEAVRTGSNPALLVAARSAPGSKRHIVMYNHYDTEAATAEWTVDPWRLTERGGRLFGLGVTDNKGALAARLAAVVDCAIAPSITWLIQGEEETGSATLRRYLRETQLPAADVWLDENGWDAADGTQLILGMALSDHLQQACARSVVDRCVRTETRTLNKHLVPGGCPFQAARPFDTPYLAIGLNDAQSRIHRPDESISAGHLTRHAVQFRELLAALEQGEA